MTDKEKNTDYKKILKNISKNYWAISTVVLAVLLIVVLISGGNSGPTVSAQEAGQSLLSFANAQGAEAGLVSVNDNGQFYEVILSIQEQEVPLYVTKDGESFTQQLIPLTAQVTAPTQEQQAPTPTEVPKSDKPVVELYVMSFCPYGNRAEETMIPVYNLLKDKVDWNINYIVSVSGDTIRSLHGQPETDQNIREVCVKNEYGLDKFWSFISYVNNNCGRDGSCWEAGAVSLELDVNSIQTCLDNQGLELMKTEAQISENAGANGSPTLLINGVGSNSVYQYENPEAYKQAICSAFNIAPTECEGILEGSSSGAATGGSC